MKSIIVTGNGRCGRTLLSVGMALNLQDASYFKPLFIKNIWGKRGIDEDVKIMKKVLNLPFSETEICPGIEQDVTNNKIQSAFKIVSEGKSLTIVESDIFYGYKKGFSALHMANLLGGKILLLIEKKDGWEDEASFFSERLNDNLLGIVLNKGEESDLKKEGLLGVIPYEGSLSTLSASQIAEELYATILAGDDGLVKVIENILVGAMTVEHANKYFLQGKNKCVITGGDREDIIIAALSTSTSCVVITGDIVPSISVIEKAERKRIPLLSVSWDTFTTAEKIEAIVPKIKPENKEMLTKIKEITKPVADKISSLLSLS
ncbi:hypothetical protein KKG61_02365 [bacterium]|nr:hypothetical protein [bacterium]MBU1598943.1 hypothetical protein [bacterium]